MKDTCNIVKTCPISSQHKPVNQALAGVLQPLAVPHQPLGKCYPVDREGYGPEDRSWVPSWHIMHPQLSCDFHHLYPVQPLSFQDVIADLSANVRWVSQIFMHSYSFKVLCAPALCCRIPFTLFRIIPDKENYKS